MNLQALLVSSDDSAADVLGRVLSSFGIATDRSSDPETALARIQQQKFDALVIDFDDQKLAEDVLLHAKKLGTAPLSVALVADSGKVRQILSGGAHFIVYKPISEDAARAALRAAAALLTSLSTLLRSLVSAATAAALTTLTAAASARSCAWGDSLKFFVAQSLILVVSIVAS